jgi:hypothetical protein
VTRREVTPALQILHILEPDEELHLQAQAVEAIVAITDRRVIVAAGEDVSLAVPYAAIRRLELNVERGRPATLLIVPERADLEPQVLSVQAAELPGVAQAMAFIGERLERS